MRIPELTRPNIVRLLSKNGVGASVRKNCEPKEQTKREKRRCAFVSGQYGVGEALVLGPELAIARIPAPVNLSSGMDLVFAGMKGECESLCNRGRRVGGACHGSWDAYNF